MVKSLAHLLEGWGAVGDMILLAGIVVGFVSTLVLIAVVAYGIRCDVRHWRAQRARRRRQRDDVREALERAWRAS